MLQEYIDEIKRRREEMGVSYQKMSKDLLISENTLTGFLSGRTIINAEYFLEICEYVGMDIWGTRNDR